MRLHHKLLLAAPVLLFLYLYGLTRVGMIGPDEPRYAAIGREMARSGDWITPRLWGDAWFEKPALLYWLIAAGNEVGLSADLAPRLPVAVVSVVFLIFFFFQIRREFGERAAWFSSAILATSAGWLAFSHVAVTDLPLAAAFGASVLLALPWVRSGGRRGLVLAGLLLGLAVLAKGLVPLILIAPLVWVGRRRLSDLLILAAACLAVAAPWYIACWSLNGDIFIHEFLWRHHFGRFVTDELQHVQPWWFYVPVVLGFLFPWTPLLVVLRRLNWTDPRQQLLATTVLFGFVFFSASTNKLPGYVLPLMPILAALVGVHAAAKPLGVSLLGACALLLSITPVIASTLPHALADGLGRTDLTGFSGIPIWLLLAGGVIVLQVWKRSGVAFAATVGLAAISIMYLKWQTYPRLDEIASARGTWLRMQQSNAVPCPEDFERSIRYGLQYYAGHRLPDCSAERQRNHDILDRR